MKFEIIKPQTMLPRGSWGVDWGRDRKLLLKNGHKEMWWRPGMTGWVSRGQQGYYEGKLTACMGNGFSGCHDLPSRLCMGQARLSAILKFHEVREWIKEQMNVDDEVIEALKTNVTVVVSKT